ncbi:hypothetical protein A4X06_0g7862 [Tilletia controversa]|uniref:Uncharacterized protein n=1 Tax=Tilletia controversa TaxID=13291 RepID=A0A8X7MKZ9_9BASI|nr:hypothetical protein A4X06_0g7862 [Tilletia controversa]
MGADETPFTSKPNGRPSSPLGVAQDPHLRRRERSVGLVIISQAGASTTTPRRRARCFPVSGLLDWPHATIASKLELLAKGPREEVQVTWGSRRLAETCSRPRRVSGAVGGSWRADVLASNRDWEGLWAVGTGQEVFVNRCIQDETDKLRLV